MKTLRQLNIEDRSGYFFGEMINHYFLNSLLNVDEASFRNDGELIMYDIKYIKNLNRLSILYLVFNHLDGIFRKSPEGKYLIFSQTEKKNNVRNIHRSF